MLYGMFGLIVVAVVGGGIVRWIIFPTPSIICLPFYLKILVIFVSLIGGWVGYEFSRVNLRSSLISLFFYNTSSFSGSIWFIPYFSTYGVSLSPLLLGYDSLKISDLGWAERLGGQGIYWFLMYISKINQWCQYNDLRLFLMFFVLWFTVLIFIIVYLNSLCLEHNIEDVIEVELPLSDIYKRFL
jgi:NADH-ubiquinone oxidoreductase chain 5